MVLERLAHRQGRQLLLMQKNELHNGRRIPLRIVAQRPADGFADEKFALRRKRERVAERECQDFCVRGLGDFSMAPLAAQCAGLERAARW
jgi:hypothetical protein